LWAVDGDDDEDDEYDDGEDSAPDDDHDYQTRVQQDRQTAIVGTSTDSLDFFF